MVGGVLLVGCATIATRTSTPAVIHPHVRPPLFARIPPADPTKYEDILDGRKWRNPYLGVRANGVAFRSGNPRHVRVLSVDGVVEALERLPDSAWPYGLVVAVSESGPRTPGGDDRIIANLNNLLHCLQQLCITVDRWP
jgi:hypothetical protein